MNALDLARAAYARPGTPVRTARAQEYDIIAQVTRRLRAADRSRAEAYPAFAEALHDNMRLWAMLAADVADPDNRLSRELRAGIVYLYEFTLRHSQRVLAENAPVDVLIDLNTSVMRGLRGGGTER